MYRLVCLGAFAVLISLFGEFGVSHVSAQQTILSVSQPPQSQVDLIKLVDEVRGRSLPDPSIAFDKARERLLKSIDQLEHALGTNSPNALNWKRYLRWDNINQLLPEGRTDAKSLRELAEVLGQLHDNYPGLELPPFTNLADAIESYIDLAPYAQATRADYIELLEELKEKLVDHADAPSNKTLQEIGGMVGLIEAFGGAEDLVAVIRQRYKNPNLWLHVSARLVSSFPTFPIDETRPVRECILGTSIRGQARTCGDSSLSLGEASDHVAIDVALDGTTYSRTTGYQKPVRIESKGVSPFTAVKRLAFSDERFVAGRARAEACTKTTILSIKKVGRKLLTKVIEKIAWRRARQQKPLAESIASRNLEREVEANMDQKLDPIIVKGRKIYEEQIRNPLVRLGIFPDELSCNSSVASAHVGATFAEPDQLGAPGPPPVYSPENDLTVQIHGSVIQNLIGDLSEQWLRMVIERLLETGNEDPIPLPELVPKWLKDLLQKLDARKLSDESGPTLLDAREPTIRLEEEDAVSLQFEGGKIQMQIRASSLQAEPQSYDDLEIQATYDLVQEGEKLLLKREGDFRVVPSAANSEAPPSKDSEVLEEATRMINDPGGLGQRFSLFEIPSISLPRLGELELNEKSYAKGWLTIGWRKH